jgi:hypothetical protein
MELIRQALIAAIESDPRSPRQIAKDCKINEKSIYKVTGGQQVAGHIYESLALNLRLKIRPRYGFEKVRMEKKRRNLLKVLEKPD